MKFPLFLVAVLLSPTLFAQTTRQRNETPNTKEIYYVLKSDKTIKEGPYAEYSQFGNKLLSEGFYKNNLKDSIWKYYSYGAIVPETGYYKYGKKIGIWNVYTTKGELELRYDFTNKKLLLYKLDTTSRIIQRLINGRDTLTTTLDQPALYLDGTIGITMVLIRHIRYPALAREGNVQGKVWIAFTVDTLGTASNFRVKSGIGAGCDEEALRVVKLIDGDWLPAMISGKPVTVEFALPISFTLSTR